MCTPLTSLPQEDIDHALDHSRDIWETAGGQSFLITSGTGFIGIWLLETFLAANERLSLGARATVLSLDPAAALGSGYGFGKRAPEHLLAVHAPAADYQLQTARCFAFVVPHLNPERYAISNFLRDALAGQPLKILGDGTPLRSYLHAADLAAWLWTLLLHPDSQGAYDIGSSEAISIADCARAVAEIVDPTLSVSISVPPDLGRPASHYVPDTGRAARELGLRQLIPRNDGIRRTAAWLRGQCPEQ